MRYELDKGSHSVYTLTYHHACCVKYRRKIFDSEDIITRLKEINIEVSKKFDVDVLDQETDLDHLHMLVKTTPRIRLSSYINSLKGVSARRLFQEFPRMKRELWGGHLWSPSYLLCTTGQVTLDCLKKYVASQGDK
ncbi:IS200/IS605 family transposase [Candidatus Bathyarchaeota archaeon]|nr:IS200/IS605 family transposase [Candidatus Bathyarchaeota archaeon]